MNRIGKKRWEILKQAAQLEVIPASFFGYEPGSRRNMLPLLGKHGLTEWDILHERRPRVAEDFKFIRLTKKARALLGYPIGFYITPPSLPLL